ncbi:hypothetical protein ABT294_10945 [Nonomuraea sp. NPDC000554]|uniref:hypothetical protein n=1 Tax=Nonomuraea sp. NPDC000554 TaxID=3154259 RepID=UPI00331D11BE
MIFTFLLLVVAGYWLVVLTGLLELDDTGAHWLGLGGVPAGIALSLMIAMAWLLSLVGSRLVSGPPLLAVPLIALVGAWLATRAALRPLRRLFAGERGTTRGDLVGRPCVIRTGEATNDFGQAEVTAPDGSSAVVQVRTTGQDRLTRGETALIFEYDGHGEFFWVMPYESEH